TAARRRMRSISAGSPPRRLSRRWSRRRWPMATALWYALLWPRPAGRYDPHARARWPLGAAARTRLTGRSTGERGIGAHRLRARGIGAHRSGPAAAGPARGTVVLAGIADVLCIFIFVFVGRRSHQEASALIGLATTAWPFLAGLAIAWAATRVWRGPLRLWPTAVLLWFLTVALGLGLRLLSGQGASGAFPLVAAAFLALVLIGW